MPRVLVIDDAIHIRRLIVRMLERAGISTLEASNGLHGFELLKEQRPDVVTCDIAMPLMDGYEFLQTVKQDPVLKDTPVIVITALGQVEEMIKARQMGADVCLTKPFSSSHLIEIIHNQLKKRS